MSGLARFVAPILEIFQVKLNVFVEVRFDSPFEFRMPHIEITKALFVRPHRSQGTGLHRPVCSFARIAPRQAGGGERIYARPLAGGGDEEGSVGGPIETGRTGWRPQPAWRSLPLLGGSRVRKIGCRKFGAGSFVGSGKDLTRRKSFVYKSVLYDFPTM
jgi:hypothetical protein